MRARTNVSFRADRKDRAELYRGRWTRSSLDRREKRYEVDEKARSATFSMNEGNEQA